MKAMDSRIEGIVVLVTGAGHGLGRACVAQLAKAGARVVVNDVNDPQPVVDELVDSGAEAFGVTASVTDESAVEAMVEATIDRYGDLDAVINNAGIFGQVDIQDVLTDEFVRMLDVHLMGTLRVSRAAWPHLQKSSSPRIVNITSGAGFYGLPRMLAYSAAKAGIVGLTHALALEGASSGILVNAVSPAAQTGDTTTGQLRTTNSSGLLASLGQRSGPEWATPIMVHLASPACDVTDHVYAAGAGRYSRIFTAEAPGWTASGSTPPSAETIAAAFARVDSLDEAVVARNMHESMALFERFRNDD